MDDPIQTRAFIKYIIDNRKEEIIGLALSEGDRMTIGKKRSKWVYLISLLLIMGIPSFVHNSFLTLFDKVKKKLSRLNLMKDPSILAYAKSQGIPVWNIKTPNSKIFQDELKKLKPDVIINQSQSIIKKNLIEIPRIGIINRHNALLPKNRGRLTPFWVLYKQEVETGVSIHFVEEGIDSGDIIVQERFKIEKTDNFNSIVKKNYQIAPNAMLKALDILKSEASVFIKNNDAEATYNSVPDLKHAIHYRKNRLFKRL
jgi:methionyl-tRNA formyltransferase